MIFTILGIIIVTILSIAITGFSVRLIDLKQGR